MKQYEHRPEVKSGLKMSFNMKSLTKRQGACVDDQIWQYFVISDISNQVGYFHRIKNLGMGSRSDIFDLGQKYPVYRTYPAFDRVPEPWHRLRVGYLWSRSIYPMRQTYPTISRVQDRGSRVQSDISCIGRIYLTRPKSTQLDSEFKG
jgi:hypothetical protein